MNWQEAQIGTKVILQRRIANGKAIADRYIETPIIGETRNSWVLRDGTKLNKRTQPNGIFLDWESVRQHEWVQQNHFFIGEEISSYIGRDLSYDQLKKIAAIIGYHGKEPK
jgi:hypothetical protein